MAPDLSEKLLGMDVDDDRPGDSGGEDGEEEQLAQFVFVAVGEHRLALPVDAVRTITEPPAELTRVPRSSPAIEGLMDLRGEVTAVIDPRVHFPTTDPGSGRERLLVLDRPSDEQSVAIRVDDVIGVETVPESDIFDDETIDTSELSGDVLEHPLIVALVTKERESRVGAGTGVSDGSIDGGASPTAGPETGRAGGAGSATLSPSRGTSGGLGESIGETFEIEPTEETTAEPDEDEAESTREIVLEATALVDVDRLLLASGQSEETA
ncbi:chemotaxis protein CheW [Natrinema ejinorense]|uniref:Chemotaxis protein CheW n=1 Tax=Natrinema ejinorense TaxID=373386 RepID=A0A2A5QVK1_9EURY|nr:chemotaxis protein CheW [Natrinema ejinorense]PCR90878.1 chemotaxis protein CheW [Natrinema ejinorense]